MAAAEAAHEVPVAALAGAGAAVALAIGVSIAVFAGRIATDAADANTA